MKHLSVATGFIDFVREQGVVGLAIGFILGGAVSKLVSSFVTDLVQPVIGLILGSTEGLKSMSYASIKYGNFLSTLIDFILVAAVVYFGFKALRIDRLDKKKK
ncbi:MAG: MscL family protein [Candidatus Magasanikbacteria bacterium]|uniref:Large conductance mechanosensitive channel protein MscL n=1 Tax=Candidatus Magasanikbacteria bacterium CG10_big_fil_rev_8_21_14_0_10_38_6 TaxID=1974647 RepID=A0A2M6P1H8_9BACT|nr:MscL family protein [Candidatus Magasanikbacteria bacterium]NCS71723.1 MscL family protein [Candidatus Magasanikbacteria bacterium]PIR77551.1 MAG: large conductance mechanosensitive channel protein MscL [Candidatus Magasanikbacteria bacterium CG10_big_fil_rev_8_21_14_0_10_38_6]